MDDQEWEAHTMEMLAAVLIAAFMAIALAMVWITGALEGVGVIGWMLGLFE